MLRGSRYYRRPYMASLAEERKPRWAARVLVGSVALVILWYVVTGVFSLFTSSLERNAPAVLALEPGSSGVQVSLQDGDWQQAEDKLKMYPEDAVATRSSDYAILRFFDETRVRLDHGSEVMIDASERATGDASSALAFTVKGGRVWIAVPDAVTYSGSIARTVTTDTFEAQVPSDTEAMISSSMVAVVRSAGEGVRLTLSIPTGDANTVTIGEGQYFSLTDEAKRQIASGKDPYEYRDPMTSQLLRDDFLVKSYAMLSASAASVDGPVQPADPQSGEDLVVTSPEDKLLVTGKTVKVAGRVNERISAVLVNGHDVPIAADGSFTTQLALGNELNTLIRIEAQDKQGITLAQQDRTVKSEQRAFAPPVRVTSPVGSGQTLTTTEQEIEITGEAPVGAAGIVINDYRLQLFKPGSKTWSYIAAVRLGNLLPGKNTFSIYAVDADGNRTAPVSIFIDLKAQDDSGVSSSAPLGQNQPIAPGTLLVDKPQAGTSADLETKETVIEGRTSADTSTISVNGYTLSLYQAGKTTWNYIASTELGTMKRGKNVYRVVARNAKGEILDVLEYTIVLRLR